METTTLPVLDPEAIGQLKRRSIRGRSMFEHMLEVFRQEAPELVEGIGGALEEANLDALYQHAHKLKGICAVMGARRLWGVSCSLLVSCDEGRLPEAGALESLEAALREYYEAVGEGGGER